MKYIGVHIDGTPGAVDIATEAKRLGARAFSFCPVDAKRWFSVPYTAECINSFRSSCAANGFSAAQILPHASLLLNLCSPDERKLSLSRNSLIDQMKRCRQLGLTMLNFHPGATLGELDSDTAADRVAQSINFALERTEGVCAVIENTAGQGSNIGYRFEQLARIIDGVDDKSRAGVCIDTCHAWVAGYDFADTYDEVWDTFERTVGFKYLRGLHLNDAVRAIASRIDRHAPIGAGTIGRSFFCTIDE